MKVTYGPGALGSNGSILYVLCCIEVGRTLPYLTMKVR